MASFEHFLPQPFFVPPHGIGSHCPNCGRSLETDDLPATADELLHKWTEGEFDRIRKQSARKEPLSVTGTVDGFILWIEGDYVIGEIYVDRDDGIRPRAVAFRDDAPRSNELAHRLSLLHVSRCRVRIEAYADPYGIALFPIGKFEFSGSGQITLEPDPAKPTNIAGGTIDYNHEQ